MSRFIAVPLVALALAASAPASAQIYVTSIIASNPDPNGKVPAFNAVPGAGLSTWSDGLAQAVLQHGQAYEYCVSLNTATADGKASVSYKIARGGTVIQSYTIIKSSNFTLSNNDVFYLCSGYQTLPDSPGAATLTGIVSYKASGSTKTVESKLSVPILLQ
jgi:hypothetical protein